ncbi:mevalonate kinase [candidate division KSB1 bacterium RBG_16_48_16]|nr:MAG: mevalonate kinase [candidate division KSB1 bacterium RBG_16_48_16]
MLLGEHAVLHGKLCLVCAVNRRISITVRCRNDQKIHITSELGECHGDLNALPPDPAFRFLLAAIAKKSPQLIHGLDLNIKSDFSHKIGFGSSAAITAAATMLLFALTNGETDLHPIFADALETIRSVQGEGSGADLAASVFGHIVAYRMEPLEIRLHKKHFPITAVYSGSKEPTVKVIEKVKNLWQDNTEIVDAIFQAMDKISHAAEEALLAEDWPRFGRLMNVNQGLMDAIGVNNSTLSEIVYSLRNDPGILGAKISGAGLGDCVVGLGEPTQNDLPFEALTLGIEQQGVRFD